ncbi:MAG: co-chaperone DjlA [Pseudomonadota bacterium]|nr:co-chaperone DjlA [Pseudomonadota bacterium]
MNKWLNVLVGAILGLIMMRHPIGALIGAATGYLLGPRFGDDKPKATPARMLYPLFALAGALAKADGRVSEAEVGATEQWMTRLDLNKAQRKQAIAAFDAGKQSGFDADVHARELAAHCIVRLDLKVMLLGALHQIASADGSMHADATRLHQRIVELLEVPVDLWRQAQAKFHHGQDAAPALDTRVASVSDYHALGVSTSASDAEVRRAYRKLLTKHHPDKLAGRITSTSERRQAEERTRTLIAAYERIKNTRGMG